MTTKTPNFGDPEPPSAEYWGEREDYEARPGYDPDLPWVRAEFPWQAGYIDEEITAPYSESDWVAPWTRHSWLTDFGYVNHGGYLRTRQYDTYLANMARGKTKASKTAKAVTRLVKREVKEEEAPRAVTRGAWRSLNKRPQLLSPCVRTYLGAIADPFGPDAVGACIPTDPSFPSQKLFVFFRGTLTTGTNSVGWVYMSPYRLAANNASSIYYTDNSTGGTYGGTALIATATAGVNLAARTNSPYTAAQIDGPNVSVRLVSCGIRVAYAGTNLNKGGRIIGFEEPTHQNLTGATYANLRSYRDVTEFDIDDHWHGVTYTPIQATEVAYSTQTAMPDSGFMAVMLTSAVSAQPFSFEVVAAFEAVGKLTASSATHNQVDPLGYAAARQVLQDTDSSSGVVADPGALRHAKTMLIDAAAHVVAGFSGISVPIVRAAGEVAVNALSSRIAGGRHGPMKYRDEL